jgi:hypothetical protein
MIPPFQKAFGAWVLKFGFWFSENLRIKKNNKKTMNTILHKAATRGHANHGWLEANHTFSFANYQDKNRMHFGVLRVLNDDLVHGGYGFGKHPHDNMEIITIPLEGALAHEDSMGNKAVIQSGDVQVMSAGTGIQHSEKNNSTTEPVKLLQIWLFPNKRNVIPRYDEISLKDIAVKNSLYQVLSPDPKDAGVWIHQDAWFHMGNFTTGTSATYVVKKEGNGVYVFVINGNITINNEQLSTRDGMGIWNTGTFILKATSDTHVLLMDVPMVLP